MLAGNVVRQASLFATIDNLTATVQASPAVEGSAIIC